MSMGQFWRALAPQGYNLYPAAGVCPRTACQSLQMQWSTCFYEILTWCNDPSNLVAMLSLWDCFACCAIIVCPNAYKSHSTPLRLIRGSVTNGAGRVIRQSLYGRRIIIDKWDASQAKHLITISSQQDLKAAFVTSRNLSSLLKQVLVFSTGSFTGEMDGAWSSVRSHLHPSERRVRLNIFSQTHSHTKCIFLLIIVILCTLGGLLGCCCGRSLLLAAHRTQVSLSRNSSNC